MQFVSGRPNTAWLSLESKAAYGISLDSKRGSIAFGMALILLLIWRLRNAITKGQPSSLDRRALRTMFS
ncbi:hypothetical protein BDI4_1040013 [Burkholderia diffusa]|nr:hypothetical protein BDI4_1040013 [Burkholderia diffusa]